MGDVGRRVRRIVARCIEVPEDALPPGLRLVEDLGADGLDVLQLVSDLEREFAIRIDAVEAAAVRTLEDMAALVEGRTGGRAQGDPPHEPSPGEGEET